MTTLDTTIDGVTVTLEHIDPSTLVMADNVRSDAAASLSKGFIGSIRERGVLEPIIADRNPEGITTVRAGHRRTLAAIEANRVTVPVMVHTGEQSRVDRLIDQIVENEHRADLTNRDKIAAVHQLALEGLSEGQIAKRAALPKKDVAAAVIIGGSTVAEYTDQLTLEQAAAMAEFDNDPEAMEKLLTAARYSQGQFAHTLSRVQQDQREAVATAELVALIEAAGSTATTETVDRYNDGPCAPVSRLRTKDGEEVTEEGHATCPGHAMGFLVDYGSRFADDDDDDDADDEEAEEDPWRVNIGNNDLVAVPVCTDWKANGHSHIRHQPSSTAPRAADMSEEEREAAKLARRRVIENNKAWDACTPVRRAWLATFAQRKAAPAGAEALVAETAARPGGFDKKDNWSNSPWEAVGIDRTQLVTADAAPKRCTHIALIHALVAWESNTSRETWRNPGEWSVKILTAMAGWGYTLSDVEQEVIDTKE